jgi:hypothetical protein
VAVRVQHEVKLDAVRRIDIVVKTGDGRKVAIEVDGPTHLVLPIAEAQPERPPRRGGAGDAMGRASSAADCGAASWPDGPTQLRNAAILRAGYRLLCVPYTAAEWREGAYVLHTAGMMRVGHSAARSLTEWLQEHLVAVLHEGRSAPRSGGAALAAAEDVQHSAQSADTSPLLAQHGAQRAGVSPLLSQRGAQRAGASPLLAQRAAPASAAVTAHSLSASVITSDVVSRGPAVGAWRGQAPAQREWTSRWGS